MTNTGELAQQGATQVKAPGTGDAVPPQMPPADTDSRTRRIRIVDAGRTNELEDPLPGASPEKVRQLLAQQIRRLTGARMEEKIEGDTQWLIFSVQTGVKGSV